MSVLIFYLRLIVLNCIMVTCSNKDKWNGCSTIYNFMSLHTSYKLLGVTLLFIFLYWVGSHGNKMYFPISWNLSVFSKSVNKFLTRDCPKVIMLIFTIDLNHIFTNMKFKYILYIKFLFFENIWNIPKSYLSIYCKTVKHHR